MADGSINGDVNSLYPEDTSRWLEYKIRFGIQGDKLKFLVTLVTENGNGWFGIGFAPADDGMDGADFIIGTLSSNTTNLGNYISNGYQPPIIDKDHQNFQVTSTTVNDTTYQIEFNRPLAADSPNRKPIIKGQMKIIMAFSPITNIPT